jgi:hypothetical protein
MSPAARDRLDIVATVFWYSGSFSDGAVTPYTCSGWTDGSTLIDGRYGSTQQTSSYWFDTSEFRPEAG